MAYRDSNELPEVFELIRLRDLCRKFINENRISCFERTYDICVNVEKPFEFIESICKLIGYYGQER